MSKISIPLNRFEIFVNNNVGNIYIWILFHRVIKRWHVSTPDVISFDSRTIHCAVTIIPSLRCFISRDFINPSSPFRSSIRFTGWTFLQFVRSLHRNNNCRVRFTAQLLAVEITRKRSSLNLNRAGTRGIFRGRELLSHAHFPHVTVQYLGQKYVYSSSPPRYRGRGGINSWRSRVNAR